MAGSPNTTTLLLQFESLPSSSREVTDSLWIPKPSTPFHGSRSTFPELDKEDNDNEGCLQQPEKKRRLTVDQVQYLERSFEVENKLEPDRKVQLAKEIGLQPRQVAIWFQNRRARYKTKQLEKDCGYLKASYDKLINDYDSLCNENDKLKNEVQMLKDKLLAREKGKAKTKPYDSINSLNDDSEKPNSDTSKVPVVKQEGASSAESEVFDSDSPRCNGYSHDYEAEPSEFSQDEDDILSSSLLQPPCFPKLEELCCIEIPGNSGLLEFPVEEDQATWFWPY